MRANLFWLNDELWTKIEPMIPMNRPGPKPKNNRRILSGILHALKTGCRGQDSEYPTPEAKTPDF
jgi:transposase